jgi:histidinol phosphatase-like enzyme (inositol monophosphatase family)
MKNTKSFSTDQPPTEEREPPDEAIVPEIVDFAVDAAQRAGRITLQWYQQRNLSVAAKSDGSPVTQADYAAERLLRSEISAAYPDDTIWGEEEGVLAGNTGRTWVIDPIDGTKAFVQGVPLYATLLALVDEQGPAVGVISLPALDECVWAGRGRGAYWNGVPCAVSDHAGLEGSYVCTSGLTYWPEPVLERVRAAGARVRTWGDAYGYALVATGRAEAMVDPECFDWDVAPMAVIMAEAGGRFSDRSGNNEWRSGSALGTNGLLHEDLLACFR